MFRESVFRKFTPGQAKFVIIYKFYIFFKFELGKYNLKEEKLAEKPKTKP